MHDRPVSIVTGAGSGIGRAVAELLAAEGHRLALVGRRPAPLEETRALVDAAGADACAVPADVAGASGVRTVVDAVMSRWGRVDVLVNNAGMAPLRGIPDTDESLLHDVFAVNAFGPALLIAAVWPHFVAEGGGVVVNVSSMATIDPFPGFLAYAASKAAVESYTRSIANEGTAHGIRGYAVAPGAVETAMLRAIVDTDILPSDETLDPSDVARVVVECITGRRGEESGATIVVAPGG